MREISNIPDKGRKKRIVIIGGGFAGLKVARKLNTHRFQVVLLDKNNYHLFQPLLYQVATSGIGPSSISFPFRKVFRKKKNFHIRLCTAERVLPEKNIVETSIGCIDYDYLIIATGCETNYFGNSDLAYRTMALKTTPEALYNRNRVLESFEKALNSPRFEDRKRLMTFVIVGAGATGIELAGSMAEARKFVLHRDYPDLDINLMRIILIDAGPRVLSAFSEKSSEDVQKHLEKLHVEILLNSTVKSYYNNILTLEDGTEITTANVFWVAGVKANSLLGFKETDYGRGNRLKVDEFNRVINYKNIFALGDTALMSTADYPNGHPQVVQPAIQQASHLVKNIQNMEKGKFLEPFKYHNKGSMATIGRNAAVLEIKNFRMSGFFAWVIWLFIHLMSILGVKNKLIVMLDWTWSYFTYDQSLRLLFKVQNRRQR
ncbi:NAD(P)/FAD-dependent oxidoreductase [Parabacteroides pacaensis]|uniref:NAD(P)/FAD-dependent oxidoreductase n=1 Tax=Parabacteroides pacaensis TaxID=2086575 RepID=UPI000D1106E3|nr:NAD(P)/FAD-dependent oxidoreductase [Parabacteroides pacaensis]